MVPPDSSETLDQGCSSLSDLLGKGLELAVRTAGAKSTKGGSTGSLEVQGCRHCGELQQEGLKGGCALKTKEGARRWFWVKYLLHTSIKA